MAKGYWVVHVTVTDPENYPKYVAAANIALQKHNGKFLARGGQYQNPEGNAKARHIIVEFESYEQAITAYNSEEYKAATALRNMFGETDFLIVEGQ